MKVVTITVEHKVLGDDYGIAFQEWYVDDDDESSRDDSFETKDAALDDVQARLLKYEIRGDAVHINWSCGDCRPQHLNGG